MHALVCACMWVVSTTDCGGSGQEAGRHCTQQRPIEANPTRSCQVKQVGVAKFNTYAALSFPSHLDVCIDGGDHGGDLGVGCACQPGAWCLAPQQAPAQLCGQGQSIHACTQAHKAHRTHAHHTWTTFQSIPGGV